ncbi:MAG: hypothetical protein NT091_04990, partial [Candidatus Falkowbacteria bacterium]|nr:hypothetical protein [Candidatus Falkowbacteria bacterium]
MITAEMFDLYPSGLDQERDDEFFFSNVVDFREEQLKHLAQQRLQRKISRPEAERYLALINALACINNTDRGDYFEPHIFAELQNAHCVLEVANQEMEPDDMIEIWHHQFGDDVDQSGTWALIDMKRIAFLCKLDQSDTVADIETAFDRLADQQFMNRFHWSNIDNRYYC